MRRPAATRAERAYGPDAIDRPGASSARARCRKTPARALAALVLAILLGGPATAGAPAGVLRVGTSGDYAPFSIDPEGEAPLDGLDLALAHAYAAERGLRLEITRFKWPDLERRLAAGDFDVAMSGVTVRPDRSVLGRFTTPIVESGAVVLVRHGASPPSLEDLGRPGVVLAVNEGGHLERAARARFPAATILAVADNAAVLGELVRCHAEGAITDTLEAPGWQARAPGLVATEPFTRDRKAWLVGAGVPELAADLDAWLAAKEADGTLAALRERWLPPGARAATATPLPALVAAIDERLALMPLVAEAKRAAGLPVLDPAQEARVLEVASQEVSRAAAAAARPAPTQACVTGLYRAQIDAAREVQEAVLAGPASTAARSDLGASLRPALARIGTRIAGALVAWQEAAVGRSLQPCERACSGAAPTAARACARADASARATEREIRSALAEGLRTPLLSEPARDAIARALQRCAPPAGP